MMLPTIPWKQFPTLGGVLESLPSTESITVFRGRQIVAVGTAGDYLDQHRRDAIVMKKVDDRRTVRKSDLFENKTYLYIL